MKYLHFDVPGQLVIHGDLKSKNGTNVTSFPALPHFCCLVWVYYNTQKLEEWRNEASTNVVLVLCIPWLMHVV